MSNGAFSFWIQWRRINTFSVYSVYSGFFDFVFIFSQHYVFGNGVVPMLDHMMLQLQMHKSFSFFFSFLLFFTSV